MGSGWLGLPLAQYFVDQGNTVKASTRSAMRFPEIQAINAEPFSVDIENIAENIHSFLDSDILIVNITSKDRYDFSNLITEIGESRITRVVFISSTSVYKNSTVTVTENSGDEDTDNALFQIEKMFQQSKQFQTTVIRFAGLIGYTRHPGNFFRSGKIVPNANAPVNLIHRDDCIQIIAALINLDIWGEVFNACASTHPSKKEFYTYARQSLNLPPPEFSDDKTLSFKEISNAKLKNILGYTFKYDDLLNLDFTPEK